MSDIPEWALNRAAEMTSREGEGAWSLCAIEAMETGRAFAKYISEHEDEPVDPLLIEARYIVSNEWLKSGHREHSEDALKGSVDGNIPIRAALAALKSRETS